MMTPRALLAALLSLLLLAPRVGLAQEASPPPADAPAAPSETPPAPAPVDAPLQRTPGAPLPGTAQPAPKRLLEAPPNRPSPGARGAAEFGASLLTGLGGGFVGLLFGYGIGGSRTGSTPTDFVTTLSVTTVVGFGLGAASGAYWGGQVAGGESDFAGPLLGMAVGGAAGLVPILASESSPILAVLVCPPLMILGSVIGYELAETGDAQYKVQPVMSLTPRGASFGLAGTF